MGPKWLWLMMSSVLVLEAWLSNGCWEHERLALLHLKPFFFGPRYSPNWAEVEGSDCCQWELVECNTTTRRVTALSLNFTYQGENYWYLNASLFLPFEELKRLDLSGNVLAGCVEREGFGKLSKLRHLEILDLSGNGFNDSTLSSLTQISTLKSLNLAENYHHAKSNDINDFKWLSRLNNLETLDLSLNNLKNNTLLHLDGLSSLRTLILLANGLEGRVHIQGNGRQLRLINLEVLDLSGNHFNNIILEDLAGFSNLKHLDIRGNLLKGSIDIQEFCALNNLETLDMSYNEVHQFVTSKEIRCLRKLKVLYLDGVSTNSKQSFSLVSLLAPFSSVKTLFLRSNSNLNKTVVTQELHVLSSVEHLSLDYTAVDINFLQSVGILTSLKTLSLFNCSLAGALPAQGWCYLKGLEELTLRGNGLWSTVSSCLGNLTFLRFLDISDNQFTGNVASIALSNLTMLQFLSLSYNQFQVPWSLKSFANHSYLKFFLSDGNELVAEPTGFQTWSPKFQLKIFTLSNCRIDERRSLQFPSFLYYQYDLRYVDISFKNVGGIRFPDWLLENNTRLEKLYMTDGSIEGTLTLPSHPHYNLQTLNISSNQIEHQIPTNICSIFPNLNQLIMSQNALKSKIPLCFSRMKSLSILDISHNHLFGGIPEELAISSSLLSIKLSNNNFDGELMPHFSPIISSALEALDLSNNHLSGKLPKWLWNYTGELRVLALANNRFQGPIPLELFSMVNLEFLDLSQNHLSGTIPSFSNLQNIKHLRLRRNKLSGSLQHAFYEESSLVTLDLSENNFTGKIPNWDNRFPVLSVLLLKANQFHGEIPRHLCKQHSLSILDLSQNKLSRTIPSCLGNLTLPPQYEKFETFGYFHMLGILQELLADMGWKVEYLEREYSSRDIERGTFAEEGIMFSTKRESLNYKGKILDMFSAIDLSRNQLTGIIPPELGNLIEILGLNLSHNNLIGPIPSTFSNLKKIESLDLSYNNFNGKIPSQLTELNALEVFTVAHNNLSGPLPDLKYQFGTFDESSYEGNPFLCGPPLKNSCSKVDSPETPDASSEDEEQGFIDMGDFYIGLGISYAMTLLTIAIILYINPYWRRAWFYFIEESSSACYFFIVDNLHRLPCFIRNI